LFPNARYFVVGYGTNDLGLWPDFITTSIRIVENLHLIVQLIRARGKKPILLDVPYANESLVPRPLAEDLHSLRDYHNHRLGKFCSENQIPLANICSKLRDEHFADELHPNEAGAQIIAEAVFQELTKIHQN
jgi:lysophospholipase L1-like esterase